MDQDQLHDMQQIHIFIGIFFQDHGHECQMPGMLCIIFLSGKIADIGLTEYIFDLIDLTDKVDLLFQPAVGNGVLVHFNTPAYLVGQ